MEIWIREYMFLRPTLSKSLEHVPSHPSQAVLRCVGRGGPGRGGAYGHGHGAAGPVTRGGVRGAAGLRLQQKNNMLKFSEKAKDTTTKSSDTV